MIALDLSRLLSRAGREVPTGIDRVELAYAEHLIAAGGPLCFAAISPVGRIVLLPRRPTEEFVAATAASWRGGEGAAQQADRAGRLGRTLRRTPRLRGETALLTTLRSPDGTPGVYLLVSHHHLESSEPIARLKRRGAVRFVCLIHDLIPIEFPEYAKPGQDERHLRRIGTAAALADAVIVNSTSTGDAFRPHLERAGRAPTVLVAPFGADLPNPSATADAANAYFVCIGTIEARKNHLLLLNLWRRLAAECPGNVPTLMLIGQRGWETENVIDMLERCPGLRGTVVEHNRLPDAEMTRLLAGARALMMPSFAEGFGFPVIEALALGVPALCSDIAAFREIGGNVPEYFDPLDGPGWYRAVLDYASKISPRRDAQMRRLSSWAPPRWDDHFAVVATLLAAARER